MAIRALIGAAVVVVFGAAGRFAGSVGVAFVQMFVAVNIASPVLICTDLVRTVRAATVIALCGQADTRGTDRRQGKHRRQHDEHHRAEKRKRCRERMHCLDL